MKSKAYNTLFEMKYSVIHCSLLSQTFITQNAPLNRIDHTCLQIQCLFKIN